MPKKDLGLISMSYGNIYVAKVSLGANPGQVVKAFLEAEAYNGPAIILAYSTCIAHGIDMSRGLEEQKKAVNSGHWPLFRFNPALLAEGKNPLQMDSKEPSIAFEEYANSENRWRSLKKSKPEAAKAFLVQAQKDVKFHYHIYKALAEIKINSEK